MGLILLFCSYICLIFPHFSDALADYSYQSVIREDAYAASSINEKEKQALLENAGIYNQHIFEQQQRMPFAYAGEDASDGTYDSLFEGFSTLCTLEIPSLSLYLPVRKGTKTETLRNGCGHLYGTSIPIGGDNTHAVIAAHSGLTEASLFSEIHLLQKGDLFYLHLLGDLLTYQVDECVTVPAGSEGPYLQIEPDRIG
ncbi:MAG: class C sortase [Lachnospiraceae bacterium]|nr:class C sortase [Candidatus Equihabitans merdae]